MLDVFGIGAFIKVARRHDTQHFIMAGVATKCTQYFSTMGKLQLTG
jgi:hypothetical protein